VARALPDDRSSPLDGKLGRLEIEDHGPLGAEFGVHPIHLGIIFVANLELGYITPPVGLNLFLASYRFKRPLLEVARASLPLLAILAIAVLLITYFPWLTTALLP